MISSFLALCYVTKHFFHVLMDLFWHSLICSELPVQELFNETLDMVTECYTF